MQNDKPCYKKFDHNEHAKSRAPDDFWGQIRRTVQGEPVSDEQIKMIVDAIQAALRLKSDDKPLAMSRLTQRLMKSIPWDQVVKRRRENFLVMAKKLDVINDMHWELGEHDVPMCYPLTLRGGEIDKIKAELVARNIFVPIYWQDALPRITHDSIEAALTKETLFLPIDQRLEPAQVGKIVDLVLEFVTDR